MVPASSSGQRAPSTKANSKRIASMELGSTSGQMGEGRRMLHSTINLEVLGADCKCVFELRYTGQWMKNHMQGIGEMTWEDGRKYVGSYSEDRKNGEGVFTWADGREYQGQWLAGQVSA
eukprot:2750616-Amphidinium_carterae.1